MQNKYVYIKEGELLRRKMEKKIKNASQLWSRQNNEPSRVAVAPKIKQGAAPGMYNLNAFDIEFRMRKKM
jgi:hypothetical protein